MAQAKLPSFDLIVATVDRTEELRALLRSLARQSYPEFRVLLVDQNEDGRVEAVRREHGSLDVVHLRSARGLSRARNAEIAGSNNTDKMPMMTRTIRSSNKVKAALRPVCCSATPRTSAAAI